VKREKKDFDNMVRRVVGCVRGGNPTIRLRTILSVYRLLCHDVSRAITSDKRIWHPKYKYLSERNYNILEKSGIIHILIISF
jgi:hypothetical protein